jgi:hypothetical protein
MEAAAELGRLKLNIYGSFIQSNRQAGAGMILQNREGPVGFTACISLKNCSSTLKAELAAYDEGFKLALTWSNEPIDVATAIAIVASKEKDRSALVHLVA